MLCKIYQSSSQNIIDRNDDLKKKFRINGLAPSKLELFRRRKKAIKSLHLRKSADIETLISSIDSKARNKIKQKSDLTELSKMTQQIQKDGYLRDRLQEELRSRYKAKRDKIKAMYGRRYEKQHRTMKGKKFCQTMTEFKKLRSPIFGSASVRGDFFGDELMRKKLKKHKSVESLPKVLLSFYE